MSGDITIATVTRHAGEDVVESATRHAATRAAGSDEKPTVIRTDAAADAAKASFSTAMQEQRIASNER